MSAVSTNVPSKKVIEKSAGLKRLSHLFYILAAAPKGKIDLEAWRRKAYKECPTDEVTDEQTRSSDCGTLACAVGYACADPQFNKEGLTWDLKHGVPYYLDAGPEKEVLCGSWGAVLRFFQLSTDSARAMFEPPTSTEGRLHEGWSDRDIARKRLHKYLTDNGGQVSEFNRIDV